VPSGRTHVSRVAICFLQDSHCSGSCLMPWMLAASEIGRAGRPGSGPPRGGGLDHEAPPFLREAFRAPVSNQAEFPWMGDEEIQERGAVNEGSGCARPSRISGSRSGW
jgi:hypothetical protein